MTDDPTVGRNLGVLGIFLGAHVLLALLMRLAPIISTLHALVTVAVGIVVAATRPRRMTAYVIAYIGGAEVLWRMTSAGIAWELGKYEVSIVLAVALLRMPKRRNVTLILGYLGLLLPSALLTVGTLELEDARQQLSFNLSGPVALTLCVIFFSGTRLETADLKKTFFAFIAPVLGIAALAYLSTATAAAIEFARASNIETSGGFGPNQVSAMLGLALLFSILILFERKLPWRARAPLLGIAVILAAQSALTFSRGGIILAFLSTIAAVVYLARDARVRVTIVLLAVLLFGVGKYLVIPRLEAFTAGKLSERYSTVDPSGRSLLAGYDLQIFEANPIMGVGPGVATHMRQELGHAGAAHTEYTRMLAEHGLLGAVAILILVLLGVRTFLGAKTLGSRAYVIAMLIWFVGFLAINAMRLVAPCFLLGLACSIAFSSQLPPRPR